MKEIFQMMDAVTLFLFMVGAVLVGLLIFKIIEDAADKNVNIFQTWKRPRLYELSFIYPLARDMKFQGMSDDEIIEELIYRYDNKRLAIQQFEPKKKKYKEAIEFVGRVLNDSEIMKKYILTSKFGKKSFLELEKEMESKEDDDESNQNSQKQPALSSTDEVLQDTSFLGKILKKDSPINRNYALDWLSALFSMPVTDPSGSKMHKSSIRNFLAVHIAFSNPKVDDEDNKDYYLFKNGLYEIELLNALDSLKVLHPDMKIPSSTGNNGSVRDEVMDNKKWIDAIRDRVLSSIRNRTIKK